MKQEERVKTGRERFMDKFPYWTRRKEIQNQEEFEYLGVGAPMVDPTQFAREYKNSNI